MTCDAHIGIDMQQPVAGHIKRCERRETADAIGQYGQAACVQPQQLQRVTQPLKVGLGPPIQRPKRVFSNVEASG